MLNYKLTSYSKLFFLIYILINLNNFSLIESIEPCTKEEFKSTDECSIKLNVKPEQVDGKFLLIHFDNLKLLDNDLLRLDKGPSDKNLYKFESGHVITENYYLKDKPTEISFIFKPAKIGSKYVFENKIHFLNPKDKIILENLNELNFFVNYKPETDLNFEKSTDDVVLFNTLQKGIILNDNDLNDKDYLLESNSFKLNFKEISENPFFIKTLVGNKECSKSLEVDKSLELKTIEKTYLLKEFTCIYMVESKDKKSNLQIDKVDLKNKDDLIFLQVKNGPKISLEDLVSTSLNNYEQYKDNLKNTVSFQPSFLVILRSSQVFPTYQPSSITVKISNVQKFEGSKDISCVAKEGETICLYVAPANEFAYLDLTNTLTIKEAEVTFYNDLEMQKPFLALTKDQVINNVVYSETQYLLIKIQTSKSFQINGKFLSSKTNCNKVSMVPSAYILKDSSDFVNKECSFYIAPKLEKESFLILNLENYIIEKNSCLTLKIVSEKDDYFSVCQEKPEDEMISKKPLQFIFKSTDHLVLKYKKQAEYKDKVLVQASFVYDTTPFGSTVKLSKDKLESLKTNNYPLNSPYFIRDYSYKINSEKNNIYVSFENYDFRSKDVLTSSKQLSLTKNIPDNFIVNKDYSLSIKSTYDRKELDEYHKGFLANFEEIECTNLEIKDSIETPSYPADYKSSNKCVWVVNKFDTKKPKYLDLSIEKQKSTLELGKIIIYDDATTKRDQLISFINTTELNLMNLYTLSTSSSKIVIIYETNNKDVAGFKIKFEEKDCSETCDDGTRCILPSIRCNFVSECLDGKDEKDCSQVTPPSPTPSPSPTPQVVKTGISGWLVTFFIIPLSMVVGALLFKHGPKALAKFKGHTYQEFNTFGEDA